MSGLGIIPSAGICLVEPYLHSKAYADEVKSRSGLYVESKPDHKSTFEGVPNRGFIVALPENYAGDHKVGQQIVFNEESPKGFKWNDKTLFPIQIKNIAAVIVED